MTFMLGVKYRVGLAIALAIVFFLALIYSGQAQQSVDVRIDRWLAVQAMAGEVSYLHTTTARSAQVGDRLIAVGDGLRTGNAASSLVSVDTGVGTIEVMENTEMRVRNLSFAPDNGRITHLYVPYGLIHLNLRRFTHRGSELEIETPAGVSGVRGTEFGVNVQADGRMGIATRSGQVDTWAQARQVSVVAGYQTLVRPGSPPEPPQPIPDRPVFNYRVEPRTAGGNRRLLLIGQIDPINRAYVEGVLQTLNYWGEFGYEIPATQGASVRVTVVTPLGDRAEYDLALL